MNKKIEIGNRRKDYIYRTIDIVIYIANEREYKGFQKKLRDLNINNVFEVKIGNYHVHIFKYDGYHFCYFLATKIGPEAATNALNEVAKEFTNVQYIVNLGCCATTDSDIGEEKCVIVADRIFDADLRRETKDGTQYSGGEKKHYKITNIFKNVLSKIDDLGFKVKYKPLIASSAFISEEDSKSKVVKAYPYAAGLEMEGVAISNYALSREIEWIVIKGISDNALSTGDDEEKQIEATICATDLFFKIINSQSLERKRVNVFVSGALHRNKKYKNIREIEENCIYLGSQLLSNNYKIVNGLGHAIGNSLVSSVYFYNRDKEAGNFTDFISIYPFPRRIGLSKEAVSGFYALNRCRMLDQSVIAIFIYGKNTKGQTQNGMHDEFTLAESKNIHRIVIPQDDFYSRTLYKLLSENKFDGIDNDTYLKMSSLLSVGVNFKESVNIVIRMLSYLDDIYYENLKNNIDF